jgi:hypothetical protein
MIPEMQPELSWISTSIQKLSTSGRPVLSLAIEDIDMSSELKAIRESLKSVNFSSLVVCPLYQNQKSMEPFRSGCPPKKRGSLTTKFDL